MHSALLGPEQVAQLPSQFCGKGWVCLSAPFIGHCCPGAAFCGEHLIGAWESLLLS